MAASEKGSEGNLFDAKSREIGRRGKAGLRHTHTGKDVRPFVRFAALSVCVYGESGERDLGKSYLLPTLVVFSFQTQHHEKHAGLATKHLPQGKKVLILCQFEYTGISPHTLLKVSSFRQCLLWRVHATMTFPSSSSFLFRATSFH